MIFKNVNHDTHTSAKENNDVETERVRWKWMFTEHLLIVPHVHMVFDLNITDRQALSSAPNTTEELRLREVRQNVQAAHNKYVQRIS